MRTLYELAILATYVVQAFGIVMIAAGLWLLIRNDERLDK